mgnify:CR=1 FL=1
MENLSQLTYNQYSTKIGKNCDIADDVIIGKNPKIGNNVRICSGTIIGDDVKIYDGAIIGSDPQHLNFNTNDKTKVIIGDNVTIREYVTINRSTNKETPTLIGDRCYLMSYSHVSHDTILGNNVILANSVQIGGESCIDDYSNIGGGALIHQRTKIGKHVMVGAGAIIIKDLIPYSLISNKSELKGINIVGIKRKYDINVVTHIKELFNILKEDILIKEKVKKIKLYNTKESEVICDFIENSKRKIMLWEKNY